MMLVNMASGRYHGGAWLHPDSDGATLRVRPGVARLGPLESRLESGVSNPCFTRGRERRSACGGDERRDGLEARRGPAFVSNAAFVSPCASRRVARVGRRLASSTCGSCSPRARMEVSRRRAREEPGSMSAVLRRAWVTPVLRREARQEALAPRAPHRWFGWRLGRGRARRVRGHPRFEVHDSKATARPRFRRRPTSRRLPKVPAVEDRPAPRRCPSPGTHHRNAPQTSIAAVRWARALRTRNERRSTPRPRHLAPGSRSARRPRALRTRGPRRRRSRRDPDRPVSILRCPECPSSGGARRLVGTDRPSARGRAPQSDRTPESAPRTGAEVEGEHPTRLY